MGSFPSLILFICFYWIHPVCWNYLSLDTLCVLFIFVFIVLYAGNIWWALTPKKTISTGSTGSLTLPEASELLGNLWYNTANHLNGMNISCLIFKALRGVCHRNFSLVSSPPQSPLLTALVAQASVTASFSEQRDWFSCCLLFCLWGLPSLFKESNQSLLYAGVS